MTTTVPNEAPAPATTARVKGPSACRREAEELLRDVALVLSLTRRVKESILRQTSEITPRNRIAALATPSVL